VRRPLLALAAAFAFGCVLTDGEAGVGEVAALLVLAAVSLGLALAAREDRSAAVALGAAALALGSGAAGAEVLRQARAPLRRLVEREGGEATVRLVGGVRGDAVERYGRIELVLDVDAVERGARSEPVRGRVRLEIGGATPLARLLDTQRVAVWARVRAASGAAARRDGVDAYAYCKSARLVDALPPAGGAPVREAASRLRERIRRLLTRHVLAGTERGLVLAMVTGDRSEIDEATAEAFRASGTYHVLALSGAQVALVAGLLVGALRFLLVRPWLQAAATMAAVSFYAVLVGGDVPVVRAALMAGVVLAGRALELDADAANALGLAALMLLVDRPSAVGDVGLQLSFAATLGILMLTGALARGIPRLPLRADVGVAASVAAQLVLSPILAARFHRLSPAAVVLNLAAVPLSSAVLLSGGSVILASPLGDGVAGLAGDVAWCAAHVLRLSGDLGPLGPWLDRRIPGPSVGLVLLHVGGLALLARHRRAAGVAALVAGPLVLAFAPTRPDADGRLRLTVIDVGQGDGLLLRSPSGRTLLVDAGGSRDPRFDPGERRVAPELWARSIRRVDALVVTHAHPDHVGGAPYVMRAFRVEEVWDGPAPLADPSWQEVQRRLDARPTARRTLAAGMGLDWDGVALRVLGPLRPRRPPPRIRNEDSIVLEVRFGEVVFLLTGDVTGEAEDALALPRAAVLKVPHHGSRTSSRPRLVAAVSPRLALVSAGAHNPFGHPHPETIARYARAGALVLRTDRDGTLRVATDGVRVWARTEAEGEERLIR
jgi:competence protein ComEC